MGDNLQQSEVMIRAAESGQQGIRQASGQLQQQYESGAQNANQMAQIAGGAVGSDLTRTQQQSQFDQQMEQRRSETELEARKAGFEPNSRQAKLDAEMQKGQSQPGLIGPLQTEDQERLRQQGQKPMEMDRSGRWRPSAEREEERKSNLEVSRFKADTDRIEAIARRDQVGVNAQKALAAGDMEAYDQHVKTLAQPAVDGQKKYDRFMKGDIQGEDWADMAKAAEGIDKHDPSLMADIQAKNANSPRVQQFLRGQVSIDAMKSIFLSMGSTKNLDGIDWTAPKMRQFQERVQQLNMEMASNPAMASWGSIDSTQKKMSFLNAHAAYDVLTGRTEEPQGQMPMATMAPGQQQGGGGQQQQLQQPGMQPPDQAAGAVRQARDRGATPNQALQAGQNVNPTRDRDLPPLQLGGRRIH